MEWFQNLTPNTKHKLLQMRLISKQKPSLTTRQICLEVGIDPSHYWNIIRKKKVMEKYKHIPSIGERR